MDEKPHDKQHVSGGLLPKLSWAEWLVFCILAGLMAAINIYSTLLIGWGDGGSIIAVIAAVMFLGFLGRKSDIQALNLAQTLVSAGGSVGFAVAMYGAVYMVNPDFNPNVWLLTMMFIGMGFLGTIVGASVRKYMVKYYFPTGTACAVIAKSISQADESPEGKRPVRLLKLYGGLAALLAIPTKIALKSGAHSLLNDAQLVAFKWREAAIGTSFDPLFYGIGMVVGPRIGLGMIIGASMPMLMAPYLESGGVPVADHGLWVRWLAIAVMTLPTFASIFCAYLFKQESVIPDGFTPGKTNHSIPKQRNLIYGSIFLIGLLATAMGAQMLFDVPFHIVILTVGISWPLCIINGRVMGDTDINPVRLVAIVLLSLFALIVAKDAVLLLGIAVVGATLAAMAVDMMQDYKTGYLVNADPTQQTSVQLIGTLFGTAAAIPFFYLLKNNMGFGDGTALPAPGAVIWSTVAKSFTEGTNLSSGLMQMIVVASLIFSFMAFLSVWPKTSKWIPSVFGVGIGLLLGFQPCFAIFLGGVIKWLVMIVYQSGKKGHALNEASIKGSKDTMLVGAAIFAAAALVSVMLLVVTEGLKFVNIKWWYLGH